MATFKELCSVLNLDERETALYELLLKRGRQTVVELTRESTIPRTQVYRLLERMESLQLVERIIDDHRTLFAAESVSRLETLVNQKVQQMSDLQKAVPDILGSLQVGAGALPTSTKFYKGSTGISQMLWHIVEQKQPVVGYTYRDLGQVTGEAFAEDLYMEIVLRQIKIKDIFSDSYVESKGGWEAAIEPEIPHPSWSELVESRYLPADVLPIPHQLDIWGDTVAFYNWHDGDVFGVEILNPKVAAFQRSIFQLVWEIAQPVDQQVGESVGQQAGV